MSVRRGARLSLVVVLLGVGIAALGIAAAAETIALPRPVPSFNQYYTDGPDAWGDCSLGTAACPDTLWESGCLVTAVASVLAYYDVTVRVSASESSTGTARTGMDPGILNDWLRANGGFDHCPQDPIGDCCLAWNRLPEDIALGRHVNRSDVGLNPVASIVIDYALRQGYPIIAGVHWGAVCRSGSSQSEDCHWVVITGKAGNTYTIVDPINWDAASRHGVSTTLDRGTKGAYIIDRYYVVSPTAGVAHDVPTTHGTPSDPTADVEPSALASLLTLLVALAAIAAAVIILSGSSIAP